MKLRNSTSLRAVSASPWSWIPFLYIAEGLPYFAVNTLTVLMYTRMDVPKEEMAFFTGWLYLPWVIKPFWSPFVDLLKSKRWWTVTMQLLIAVTMSAVGFFMLTPSFFTLTLIVFWLMAFFSATHDIAADGFYMMALNEEQQAGYVGVRSTFYRIASVIGQGGVVILAGFFEERFGNIPSAWSVTFFCLSALFFLIFLWDLFIMPRPAKDRSVAGVTARSIIVDFGKTFITFFQKKYIWTALLFILLYRLPEALCLKLVQPFLIDPVEQGGLALSTGDVGIANGTVGVLALLAGGVVGGVLISRRGLKYWLWPMALSLTLPCLVYCLFAYFQPSNFILICIGLGIEQFGYGFGFTAYMLYMMYFTVGESQTSHYAFCTAFMALGMMVPGMFAGWIFNLCETLNPILVTDGTGYLIFFSLVVLTSLFTFLAVALVRPTLTEKQ